MQKEKRGIDLLHDSTLNKSTAFTEQERKTLGLTGLLPAGVETEDLQMKRAMMHLDGKGSDLERYIYLIGLLDTNETLFYKLLMSDPAKFLPIVYDPTVGEACLKFGHIFRRPRGLYLSIKHKGHVKEVLKNWPQKDIRFICATSGGRILGLGDLGANGMGIPIGKLQLYTACAAIPPDCLLPIHIDCGTTNLKLINDPFYLGLRQNRVSVQELDDFVKEFVLAVQEVFPKCCLHFEDWAGVDAMRLLDTYKDKVCCYNDDIQGTAGVALAGIFNALRISKKPLTEQRILFLGAGSAGVGIANMIASAMTLEGKSFEEARECIWHFDIKGLLESSRRDLFDFQKPYAHKHAPCRDFVEAIKSIKPTALVGVSTKGKSFSEPVIEAMSNLNERPIIFALSNPTDHAECTPEEAYKWSNGQAIYASGVPFDPVTFKGKAMNPGQGNNLYIFPAVSLAVYVTEAKRVTDEMFIEAAKGVAEQVSDADLSTGRVYPPQKEILKVEVNTAVRVCRLIFAKGLAGIQKPSNLTAFIESKLYKPIYPS